MPKTPTGEEKKISSPTELEGGDFIRIRGRIVGGEKIGKRPGLIVLGIGTLLLAAIVYGVAHSGIHRSIGVGRPQPLTIGAQPNDPWWRNQSDAVQAAAPTHTPRISVTSEPLPPGIPDLGPVDEIPHGMAKNYERASIPLAVRSPYPIADLPAIPPIAEPQPYATTVPAAVAKGEGVRDALTSGVLVNPNTGLDELDRATTHAASGTSEIEATPSAEPMVSTNVQTFTISAGTVIPAALVTAIDSDLPGLLVAQVTQNTYDSLTGHYLLIPQGTRIIGQYDSRIAYAQDRLRVTWQRLILPDGSSVDLRNMAGADTTGRSGFDAQVDKHTRKLFQGAILLSVIGAGAQLSQPRQASTNGSAPSVGQVVAGSVGGQIANTSTQIVQRQLDVPPNLRVPAGYQFNVAVDHDIAFPTPYVGP